MLRVSTCLLKKLDDDDDDDETHSWIIVDITVAF